MKKFCVVLLFVLTASFVSLSTAVAATTSVAKAHLPLVPTNSKQVAENIGQTSNYGPSIIGYCADMGESVTFTGTDNRVNTYSYEGGINGSRNNLIVLGSFAQSTPASTCHQGNTWFAYKNANGQITLSEWEFIAAGTWETYNPTIPNESVDNAPALVSCQNTLYLGWVGTDSSHHLNIMQVNTGFPEQSSITTLTDYTRSGAGLALACLNNQVYISWLASSGTPHFYLGAYQPGNKQLQYSGQITSSDYAETHPAMSASNQSGLLEFLWKGDTDTRLFWATYNPSARAWSGGSPVSGIATLYTPAADHAYTAYTGTDHKIYVDYQFIFH